MCRTTRFFLFLFWNFGEYTYIWTGHSLFTNKLSNFNNNLFYTSHMKQVTMIFFSLNKAIIFVLFLFFHNSLNSFTYKYNSNRLFFLHSWNNAVHGHIKYYWKHMLGCDFKMIEFKTVTPLHEFFYGDLR